MTDMVRVIEELAFELFLVIFNDENETGEKLEELRILPRVVEYVDTDILL